MEKKYYEQTKAFLQAIGNGQLKTQFDDFYHQDIEQIEYPNLLTKELTKRNKDMLLEGIDKGKQVLQRESYELIKYFESGDVVIIEAIWRGKLAIPLGSLAIGEEMKAYFAQFYEYKEGKIYKQRNYDCFKSFIS